MTDAGDSPARRSRAAVEQLSRSAIFRDYQRAFHDATGLPLSLRPVDALDLPHQGNPRENPFCALMGSANPTCGACLQLQHAVVTAAGLAPQTRECYAGLCETAVPVRVGENLIAYLQTGQVRRHRPTRREFSHFVRRLAGWGVRTDRPRVEAAFFQTRVLTRRQYESLVSLLHSFAQHLGALSNQLIVQETRVESPQVARAKAFIFEHQTDDLALSEVARAANMSAFYFCKVFRHATGLTFTEYLARIRVEKVKRLLLDPHRRVSEVAFATGFQSLSQFNRVFRKVAGEAPSAYRARVQKTAAA